MDFNINKYKWSKFHDNPVINSKIKALLLYFDYLVYDKKLPLDKQLYLVEDWIIKFEKFEMYEMIPPFNDKRELIIAQMTGKTKLTWFKKIWKRLFNKK